MEDRPGRAERGGLGAEFRLGSAKGSQAIVRDHPNQWQVFGPPPSSELVMVNATIVGPRQAVLRDFGHHVLGASSTMPRLRNS